MLRTLTAGSRLLRSSQLHHLTNGLDFRSALVSCQAAGGCQQQYSSCSSSLCQWPQQYWRSSQPSLQQWAQPAAAHSVDTRLASFTTTCSPAQQQQTPQQKQSQQEHQQRQAQSRLIQFEYKTPTLTMPLPDHPTMPLPLLQAGVLPNPIKTARHIWSMGRNWLSKYMALAMAYKNIPGCDDRLGGSLAQEVATMYVRINEAQATGNLDRIRDLVSRDLFLKLRAQAEQRRIGGWNKIVWQLENEDELHDPKAKNVKLVEARMLKLSKDSPFDWLQMTYCIRSKQRFAAYKTQKGEKDELVAGSPDEIIDVEDYWMVERKTRAPVDKQRLPVEGSRWRLVKRQTRPKPL